VGSRTKINYDCNFEIRQVKYFTRLRFEVEVVEEVDEMALNTAHHEGGVLIHQGEM
jgi:hypothetical protein